MNARIKKSNAQFDQVLKIEQDYAHLATVPFKLIERFEKKQLPGLDFNFSGILIVNEFNLDRNQPKRPVKPQAPTPSHKETQHPVRSSASVNQLAPPSAPLAPPAHSKSSLDLAQISPQIDAAAAAAADSTSLVSWIAASHMKPQSESTISNFPTHMTTFENLLFSMDNSSYLSVYERAFTAELKPKNSLKLGVPNPRGIAANENYFAVSYAGLKKEQMKGTFKNMNPTGVILYRREQYVVCTIYDKVIELRGDDVFKAPTGLAMTKDKLLVCDKELRSVLKFDLKTGALLQRANLVEGEPSSVSINGNKFVITDCVSSMLYVFELDTFAQLRCASLRAIDQLNGAFNTILTDDELVFVKNSENQITVLDRQLQQRAHFNEINARIQNIAFIRQNNQMLIIGCINNKQQYKFFGYIV